MNTVEKGNGLRDEVYNLLIAAQKRKVEMEKYSSGQKIDVYYEDDHMYSKGLVRIACECKNYNKPLDKNIFSKIFSGYNAAYMKGDVNYLFIVTVNGITSSVIDQISAHSWIEHYTIKEFRSLLMNFSGYINALLADFREDGLDEYFVHPYTTEGVNVKEYFMNWIESESSRPLAILAGYGAGKTSFSKKIARDMAQDLNTKASRIPILIRMGDFFDSFNIESLLGKYFTNDYIVPGYNFPLFCEFNRQGLFVIILDGFDEMKHGMGFDDFISNIKQFYRLIVPESKVVLMGRPNAFMSDDEKNTVLHGYREMDGILRHQIDQPDFLEIELGDFSKNQLKEFFELYMSYLVKRSNATSENNIRQNVIDERLRELCSDDLYFLAKRPVHAKMLSVLALSSTKNIKAYNRFDLYKHFMNSFFERELEKKARMRITSMERRYFIQSVAWHCWKSGLVTFREVDIPNSFYARYANHGQFSESGIFRELISGSVVERKSENLFYFSHRSFQEFLAAEYIISLTWREDLSDISGFIVGQVKDFLFDSQVSDKSIAKIYEKLIQYNGSVNSPLLSLFSEIKGKYDFEIYNTVESEHWDVVIEFLALYKLVMPSNANEHAILNTFDYAYNLLLNSGSYKKLLCLWLVFVCVVNSPDEMKVNLLSQFLGFIFKENLKLFNQIIFNASKVATVDSVDGSNSEIYKLFENSIRFERQGKKDYIFFDPKVFNSEMEKYLSKYAFVPDLFSDEKDCFWVHVKNIAKKGGLTASEFSVVRNFFWKFPNPKRLRKTTVSE